MKQTNIKSFTLLMVNFVKKVSSLIIVFHQIFLPFKLENYRPDDAKFFQLDKLTRMLSLKQDLDRETVDRHQIKIIATNLESFPSKMVSENSMLLVDITVNDVSVT